MEIQVTPAHYTDGVNTTNPAKNTVFAYFHEVVDEDPVESKKHGRPIARSRVFICKQFPGTTDKIDKPAKEKDKMEYPAQWAAFQAKQPQTISGTALEMWPQMSRTVVYEMKALGVHTVEQLLAMPDAVKHKIMGYQQMAQRAQAFLDATVKPKALEEERERVAKARADLAAAQETIAAQGAQLKEQGQKIEELTTLVTEMAAAQAKRK